MIFPDAVYVHIPIPVAYGTVAETTDINGRFLVLKKIVFSSPAPVRGLVNIEHIAPFGKEYYFFGYRCMEHNEVYLVPDTVTNIDELREVLECINRKAPKGTRTLEQRLLDCLPMSPTGLFRALCFYQEQVTTKDIEALISKLIDNGTIIYDFNGKLRRK